MQNAFEVSSEELASFKSALSKAIESRKAYELAKCFNAERPDEINTSMQDTLKSIARDVSHDRIVSILCACKCDAERINRAERVNARYNVYAYQKDVNIARSIARVASLNHYTKAILATAKKLHEKELTLTHDDAQSACSLSVRAKDTKRQKMIVQYQKHVAKNTASTQSSSSINALQAFDILRETRDASNVVCYALNVESEAYKALAELI